MNRREILRAAGAAAALSFLPRDAEAAWARVRSGYRAAEGLTPDQRALVSAIADTIFPRTDTPSASDVAVTDWVNLIVAEYYADDVRSPFVQGLDAIDTRVRTARGQPFAALDAAAPGEVITTLDSPVDRRTVEARAYARLKGLVVHGYFTSARVQQDVLHSTMFYERFQGAADMPARRTP